jgi:two-component system sensor histidine kinase ChvG
MASLDGMTSNRRGPGEDPDVVLGEDWEKERDQDDELTSSRSKRGFWTFRRSPLTRKIVTFNLIALNILIIGVLYLNSSRESLIGQRADALVSDAMMVSTIVSVSETSAALSASRSLDGALQQVPMEPGQTLYVFDTAMNIVALREDVSSNLRTNSETKKAPFTPISDGLDAIWTALERILPGLTPVTPSRQGREAHVRSAIAQALKGSSQHNTYRPSPVMTEVSAVAPVERNGQIVGAVALIGAAGEIDQYVKAEREGVFHLLIIGTVVSIVLSLVLASTISNPLNDLATAAELGRDKSSTSLSPARIRIPDLSARPDEIGRLSGALRGMVSALYDRIDANEQFAADVAHEIKNPLASLRSAVGTLRFVKTDEQREKLLDVIDHDVRRLDRLVSDISNASRLDSELVKETQQPFDLLRLVANLSSYLGSDAQSKGVDFISDLPDQPVIINGLEARLAQVFVNLITNAISFCKEGDAIRIWVRTRENRVLVVVEDTGPGIPEEALGKVFNRFYSERPADDFGNNSGLGLAISKQIVEAHDGVIWAENIRPTQADIGSAPLGARFVVGLPL